MSATPPAHQAELLPVQTGRRGQRRLVILTNIPTPYRTPFFNSLHEALQEHDAGLHVLYCATIEPNRQWHVHLDEQRFPWQILPGWHPSFRGFYPHINPAVIPALRRLRPAWLLCGGAWNTPTMLMASMPRLIGNTPRIFWSEGHENAVRHPRGAVAALRRSALMAYDAFAVPNEASERFVRASVGPDVPVLRLPNTVADEFYSRLRQERRESARHRLKIASKQAVLLSVAQLEHRKGTLELLEAYDSLPQHIRERSALILAGDGSLRHEASVRAARIANGSVRLVGHQDQEEMGDWLAAADAFVLPTKRDPNPLSVIEAAFASLPLVVSRLAGNAGELVIDGETGFSIDSPDPEGIAKALRRLFESQGSWEVLGRRAAEAASAGFRRTTVARRFAAALASGIIRHGT